jgi:hypothetical protein
MPPLADECLFLDINKLKRDGMLKSAYAHHLRGWRNGEEAGTAAVVCRSTMQIQLVYCLEGPYVGRSASTAPRSRTSSKTETSTTAGSPTRCRSSTRPATSAAGGLGSHARAHVAAATESGSCISAIGTSSAGTATGFGTGASSSANGTGCSGVARSWSAGSPTMAGHGQKGCIVGRTIDWRTSSCRSRIVLTER